MDIMQLGTAIDEMLERLRADGYSEEMVKNSKWILRHFRKFCIRNGVDEVGPPAMAEFLRVQYDLDIDARDVTPSQCVIRKPLLTLWELHTTGTYLKGHQKHKLAPPERFAGLYEDYAGFVGGLPISQRTADMKLGRMRRFLEHLESKGLERMEDLAMEDVHAYVGDGEHSKHESKRDAYYLREALDWMHGRGTVGFGGREAFPVIKAKPYSPVPSYYTDEEVARMLAAIDNSTKEGKRDMLAMSLFAHYGMRCGDVAALETGDIDWSAGRIGIVQGKTGLPLSLPLIDEVKLPLLDYLKNARPESDDPHVFITTYAPHTPYKDGAPFHRMVTNVMKAAGIEVAGRRHGSHALRHSVASGLLESEVPLPTIGGVLGHADAKTTEAYLSIDERRLASLSQEVPHVDKG